MTSYTRRLAPVLFFLCLLSGFPAHAETVTDTESGEPEAGEDWEDENWDDIDWDAVETFYAGEITVTGTRTEKRLSDSPVVTEIITAEEIENSSAATLSEVLDDYGLM